MVTVDLDEKPADIHWKCLICGKPFLVTHYQILDKWVHPTVHDRCADQYYKKKDAAPGLQIPERFAHFDGSKLSDEARSLCGTFTPQSEVHTLVIVGPPHKGKSRLLWNVVKGFFVELGHGWVDAFLFEELMAEFDKEALRKIAAARYVLVDDIGAVESYGRERAGLQAAIRTRIKNGLWTFLSIDSMSFDPELENVFKGRAIVVAL